MKAVPWVIFWGFVDRWWSRGGDGGVGIVMVVVGEGGGNNVTNTWGFLIFFYCVLKNKRF